jgi:hypothetical protein
MRKKHHPNDRAARRRSAQAKALQNPLYRNRKIDGKKRKILVDLKEKETKDELRTIRNLPLESSELSN